MLRSIVVLKILNVKTIECPYMQCACASAAKILEELKACLTHSFFSVSLLKLKAI